MPAAEIFMKGADIMVAISDLYEFVIMLCAVITLVIYTLWKK